jgi:hypothetical protein
MLGDHDVWLWVRGALVAVALGAGAVVAPAPAGASSQALAPQTVVNGPVEALATYRHRLYLGGRFGYVGPRTGPAALVGADGQVRSLGLDGPGAVAATVADGSGGFFVAGFLGGGGAAGRSSVVHVLADGRPDPAFRVDVGGAVHVLGLDGGRLFVGGSFSDVNAAARQNVAALDAASGAVDPGFVVEMNVPRIAFPVPTMPVAGPPPAWAPCATYPTPSWSPPAVGVTAMAVADGRLYLGGTFVGLGGQPRFGIGALDEQTGQVDRGFSPPSQPPPPSLPPPGAGTPVFFDPEYSVNALAVSDGRLFVASNLPFTGAGPNSWLVALDAHSGSLDGRFAPGLQESPTALAAAGNRVYAGGSSWLLGPRASGPALLALDAATGTVDRRFQTNWPEHVTALTVEGARLLAGGQGSDGGKVAALDLRTGATVGFGATMDGTPSSLAAAGDRVVVGGSFDSAGGVARDGLAAIDTHTGKPDEGFHSAIGGEIQSLLIADGRLYVGRPSHPAPGPPESALGLRALDPRSGDAVADFAGDVLEPVLRLASAGGRLYVGGPPRFSSTRPWDGYLHSLDLASGKPQDAFRPPSSLGLALGLVASPRRVYIGQRGYHTPAQPGGTTAVTEPALRALDAITGAPIARFRTTAFAPRVSAASEAHVDGPTVSALALRANRLYAAFASPTSHDLLARILALDPNTGRRLHGFTPVPMSADTLLIGDRHRHLYALGAISHADALVRINPRTGHWQTIATMNRRGCALALADGHTYVAGDLNRYANRPTENLAATP